MNLHIASKQRYSCLLCGRCCRRFHVLLQAAEIERLAALPWEEAERIDDFHVKLKGQHFFRRREDGACVFLDEQGVCSMHRRFGFDIKALTCRGYPFNFATTFPGEVSVLARMDCPAVVQNHGQLICEQRSDLEKLAGELHFGTGFTPKQLQGLSRDSVLLLRDQCRTLIQDDSLTSDELARLLMSFCERMEKLGASFINDAETIACVMPSVLANLKLELPDQAKLPLGIYDRIQFRQWFALYCRRDEESCDRSLRQRLKRSLMIARVITGGGNLRLFGQEHPDLPLRQAKAFATKQWQAAESAAWEPYRRFLDSRLECLQFFGVSYYGADFFTGMRALFLSYPLVLYAARIHAASQQRRQIQAEDVMYGVAAIDHVHGRSPLLQFQLCRKLERFFSNERFCRLLSTLGQG
jgi:lysine-N-methylase